MYRLSINYHLSVVGCASINARYDVSENDVWEWAGSKHVKQLRDSPLDPLSRSEGKALESIGLVNRWQANWIGEDT